MSAAVRYPPNQANDGARSGRPDGAVSVETRLAALGLRLPDEPRLPQGFEMPFVPVRISGSKAYVTAHCGFAPDGSVAGPFGRVPSAVSLEAARGSARLATLTIFGSLARALGSLDRVHAWLMVNGYVNADPGYENTWEVLNAASDLILATFGQEVGAHARTALGVSTLPFNLPVVIAAELEIELSVGQVPEQVTDDDRTDQVRDPRAHARPILKEMSSARPAHEMTRSEVDSDASTCQASI